MKIYYKIISNAILMVKKNIKDYLFLSVTIILSFSALGIYVLYSDSDNFNENKDVLKASSNVILIDYSDYHNSKIELLEKKMEKMEDTYFYRSIEYQGISLSECMNLGNVGVMLNIHVIPNDTWGYYFYNTNRVELSNGSHHITVGTGEIVIPEQLYDILCNDNLSEDDLWITIPMETDGIDVRQKYKVTDTYKSDVHIYETDTGKSIIQCDVFVGTSAISQASFSEQGFTKLTIYSKNVKEIESYAYDLGLSYSSVLSEKESIKNANITAINTEKIIVIVLLLLLGLNLFSSFSNAMKERKYEIAVRRALGASKMQVITQFLVEGLIVMVTDMLISIAIIIVALSGYKLYRFWFVAEHWSIKFSSYSIQIFTVSCVFLSLFFSVLFAIMSTRVEIIKYIKGE